jgi:hypothetical protein
MPAQEQSKQLMIPANHLLQLGTSGDKNTGYAHAATYGFPCNGLALYKNIRAMLTAI